MSSEAASQISLPKAHLNPPKTSSPSSSKLGISSLQSTGQVTVVIKDPREGSPIRFSASQNPLSKTRKPHEPSSNQSAPIYPEEPSTSNRKLGSFHPVLNYSNENMYSPLAFILRNPAGPEHISLFVIFLNKRGFVYLQLEWIGPAPLEHLIQQFGYTHICCTVNYYRKPEGWENHYAFKTREYTQIIDIWNVYKTQYQFPKNFISKIDSLIQIRKIPLVSELHQTKKNLQKQIQNQEIMQNLLLRALSDLEVERAKNKTKTCCAIS